MHRSELIAQGLCDGAGALRSAADPRRSQVAAPGCARRPRQAMLCPACRTGRLEAVQTKTCGGFNHFRDLLGACTHMRCARGWIWRVLSAKRMKMLHPPNSNNLLLSGKHPLAMREGWERPHCIDHRYRRQAYTQICRNHLPDRRCATVNLGNA